MGRVLHGFMLMWWTQRNWSLAIIRPARHRGHQLICMTMDGTLNQNKATQSFAGQWHALNIRCGAAMKLCQHK